MLEDIKEARLNLKYSPKLLKDKDNFKEIAKNIKELKDFNIRKHYGYDKLFENLPNQEDIKRLNFDKNKKYLSEVYPDKYKWSLFQVDELETRNEMTKKAAEGDIEKYENYKKEMVIIHEKIAALDYKIFYYKKENERIKKDAEFLKDNITKIVNKNNFPFSYSKYTNKVTIDAKDQFKVSLIKRGEYKKGINDVLLMNGDCVRLQGELNKLKADYEKKNVHNYELLDLVTYNKIKLREHIIFNADFLSKKREELKKIGKRDSLLQNIENNY